MVDGSSCPESAHALDPPQDNLKMTEIKLHDVEGATLPLTGGEEFSPFEDRKNNNPTTDFQTLTHLLKSTLGSGIMTMPYAFQASGIIGGIVGGLLVAAICTHTSYILVDCAHVLYYRMRKKRMDYADVVESAFATGPDWGRKYAKFARYFIQIWLFSAYFGACSADNVLISTNFGQVIKYHMNKELLLDGDGNVNDTAAALLASGVENDYSLLRAIMGVLLVPLILFVWVPDLKYLAPISTIANIFMACVLGITCYYIVQNPLPMEELSLMTPVSKWPQFLSCTLFAMENIGVMMPLENNMKKPRNFLGAFGVLNKGMFFVTIVYLLLGVLGYMKYGHKVETIITTNLPVSDVAAQIVKILIASTVLFSFSLQFYVCREMVWLRVEKYFPDRPRLAEYSIRAFLVISCVSLAIAVPMISPLVTLVGALGFSLIGIICPAVIEILVYWEIGFGPYKWKLHKDILLILFGIISLYFGTESAVHDIVGKFKR